MKPHQLAVAVLALCAGASAAARAESETRPIGPIDAIALAGAARLEITVGQSESLTLDGDSALLREVVTEVRGTTLHIGREPEAWRAMEWLDRGLTIRVSLPRLTALQLSGSNQASIAGLDGDRVSLALNGSNQLQAHGKLGKLALRLNGSARADLSDLAVEDAEVNVHGSGHAILQLHQSLAATVHGSGKVVYAGDPVRVTADMHGNGSIERR